MKVVACGSRPRFSSVSSLHCGRKGFKKIIIIRKVHCTFLFTINPGPRPGVVQSLSHTCLSGWWAAARRAPDFRGRPQFAQFDVH